MNRDELPHRVGWRSGAEVEADSDRLRIGGDCDPNWIGGDCDPKDCS